MKFHLNFQILKDDIVKVFHSICQQIWKTQQWPQDWKRFIFIPVPKKGNAKWCSNCCTTVLISHARKGKRIPEKHLLLLHWLCPGLWLCKSQQTVENSLKDGSLNHLTCLLRNLYAGQEATVRTRHRTIDWFKIGEGVPPQDCILSPCLFNFYEYRIWNARLDESQAGIRTAGRNNNNLRYVDDTTLMAESKEELKSLLIRVKRRVKKLA